MKYCLLLSSLLLLINHVVTQILYAEALRVLASELENGFALLCPETGSPETPNTNINQSLIYWLNDAEVKNLAGNQIPIATLNSLKPVSNNRFILLLKMPLVEVSCGYYYNYSYTRIKKWNFTYVNKPEVLLKKTVDDKFFTLTQFNSSFYLLDYRISNETLFGLSQSRKNFKLDCEPNFDRPLIIQTILKLNYIQVENNQLVVYETLKMSTYSEKIYPNDMQIFESDKRNYEFSTILQNLYNTPGNGAIINLQCVAYLNGLFVAAESGKVNIIKRNSDNMTNGVTSGLTTREIVLICATSLLGILLLLSLVIFLYYFFCVLKVKNEKK